jgi:hypothetical protein
MNRALKEGIDFYWSDGNFVFTAKCLAERGYCCGNGCRHCPYDYKNVSQPLRNHLLAERLAGSEDVAIRASDNPPGDPITPGTSS